MSESHLRADVVTAASARAAAGATPLTLEDLATHVRGVVAERRSDGAEGEAWRCYEEAAQVWGSELLPLTPEKVLGFALGECLRGISTLYLLKRLTALRTYAIGNGLAMQGWNSRSLSEIKAGAAALRRDFPAEVIRSLPMTDEVMRRVLAYLQPYMIEGELYALMWWSMLTLAYAGCLRSVSFLAGALTLSQMRVTVNAAGKRRLEAHVCWRKMSRNVKDRDRDWLTVPGRGGEDADLDALTALETYAAAAGLTLGVGSTPLYDRRRRNGNLWPQKQRLMLAVGKVSPAGAAPASSATRRSGPRVGYLYPAALKEFKWLLRASAVPDAAEYAWHSLRRGCATRLLAAGAPWDVVKKLGGWASDAAMENYDARGSAVADAVEHFQAEPAEPGAWALGRVGGGIRGGRIRGTGRGRGTPRGRGAGSGRGGRL